MKRIFISTTFALLFSAVMFIPSAYALDLGVNRARTAAGAAGYDAAGTTETSLAETIGTVIRAALSLVGVVFTFLIAWAGNMWLMARGNEEEITKARKLITGSVLGLVITLSAYAISNFAVNAILEKATAGSAAGQQAPAGGGSPAGGGGLPGQVCCRFDPPGNTDEGRWVDGQNAVEACAQICEDGEWDIDNCSIVQDADCNFDWL